MPPLQSIGSCLRMCRTDRGNICSEPQRRGHRGDSAALQEMSSGDRQMQNSCCFREDSLFEHDRFGKPPYTFPDHALLRTQYKARVRQISLLFPHDTKATALVPISTRFLNANRNSLRFKTPWWGTTPVRRNVPITTTRSSNANGQAMPGRHVAEVRADCRNVISPPSAAEPEYRPGCADRRSRRRARCPW